MLESIFEYFKHFPEFNASLGAGMLIFARFLGFILLAPVLSRKDIPMLVKISLAMLMTVAFIGILPPQKPPANPDVFISIILNFVFGAIIGFIGNVIFIAIAAAGDMVNMQMGLSASVMFDPSTKEQTSDMGRFFTFLGTVIFMEIGGIYWIISAFERGFQVFPLYGINIPLKEVLNIDYLVVLTGNVLYVGLQMASPILIATLAMDVILGIISKTAPQVNVFQLSFLFKPLIGVAIIVILLPLLVNVINDYFVYYSQIY